MSDFNIQVFKLLEQPFFCSVAFTGVNASALHPKNLSKPLSCLELIIRGRPIPWSSNQRAAMEVRGSNPGQVKDLFWTDAIIYCILTRTKTKYFNFKCISVFTSLFVAKFRENKNNSCQISFPAQIGISQVR